MVHDNIVIFKGKKDGLAIILDRDAGFAELADALSAKVKDAGRFFGGAKMSMAFEGRELSDAEETQLLDIIIKEANLNVSFVKEPVAEPRERPPEKIERMRQQRLEDIMPPKFNPHEHMLTIHKSSLRSGMSIRYPGSVLVLGGVNAGAEIIAEGSIIVLGTVKGVVHAGCMGDTESFVAALSLMPVQLRIADRVTVIPEEMIKKGKKNKMPSYAYFENGQIYIAPLE
ncbi:MAG: septum site-determining protein MinC [Defluviitaleaceae bacterium]|nr:septum site-determining protein MinC [Defluviitaleaceae bacterium]